RRPLPLHSFPTRRSSDLRLFTVDDDPASPCRLTLVALPHPRQQRQIALVPIAIDRLAVRRGLGCDVEQNRQRRGWQILLNVGQPDRKSTRLNSSHQIISY